MFAALLTIGAMVKIVIPIGIFTVTFSLQFFFALLAGFLLGPRDGFLSVLAYLILGLVGFPVYAHGGGPSYLLRPTYGFLIGFAAAAFVVGALTSRRKRTLKTYLFAAVVGEMVYYACGLLYYGLLYNLLTPGGIGLAELLSVWFLSTVIPDLILAALAAATAAHLAPALGASWERAI